MEIEYKKAQLATINKGAAPELFAEAFGKVLDNINDISTDANAVREIVMKFKIKPGKDRSTAKTTIECTTKLPGIIPHESHIFLGHEGNKPVAHVSNMSQQDLPLNKKTEETNNG